MTYSVLSAFVLLAFTSISNAQIVLSDKTDERFGGYYVDVTKTREVLAQDHMANSTAYVLGLQKNLRKCLEEKSKSFFRKDQEKFLNTCVSVSHKASSKETQLKKPFTSKGLTVVFDLDETLVTAWSKVSLEHPEKTTFTVLNRDVTLSEEKRTITFAPKGVTVRPGAELLLKNLVLNTNVERIYFFSAREDKSAEEIKDYFIKRVPILKNKFSGLYARNSLRLDGETNVPSKDLRIISPRLKNVILIDDNPSRVMQKELNFSIPKFNADLYIEAVENNNKQIMKANQIVMPFVNYLIDDVATSLDVSLSMYFYSTKRAELEKIDWGKEILTREGFSSQVVSYLLGLNLFVQDFFAAETIQR